MRNPPPCKGCADRQEACHAHCDRYGAWHEERSAYLAERTKQNELRYILNKTPNKHKNDKRRKDHG